MKTKTKKHLLGCFTAMLSMAFAFAIGSAFVGGSSAALADTSTAKNELNVTMSNVKYKISKDSNYLLLVTAFKADDVIADTENDYIIGYAINGTDTLDENGKKYYESLNLKTGEDTTSSYTAKDIFGSDYEGYFLNVYEVENYDAAKDYAVSSFIKQITPEGDTGYTVVKTSESETSTLYGKGTVTGTLSSDNAVTDFSNFTITLYQGKESYTFADAVNSNGDYSFTARIGKYVMVVSSDNGYSAVVEDVNVGTTNNLEVKVEKKGAIGNVVVNDTTVKTYANVTADLVKDYADGVVKADYGTVSDIVADDYSGQRRNYVLPIATKTSSGMFRFNAMLQSTNAYGNVGVAITDGTLFVNVGVSTNENAGKVTVSVGKFTENGWYIQFNTTITTTGIDKQTAKDFLAKIAIERTADGFNLYTGKVLFAKLTKDGLTVLTEEKTGLDALTEKYSSELENFMDAKEYAFMYTSLSGLAGWVNYSEYTTVNGTLVAPTGITADIQDTRLVIKDSSNKYTTYHDIVAADGSFTVELNSGSYNFLFSNPADLNKSQTVTIDNENVSLNNITLDNKKLATNSVVLNNTVMPWGENRGEFTGSFSANTTADSKVIFDNTVYKGEAYYTAKVEISKFYGDFMVGIVDGQNGLRIKMANGYQRKFVFEYLGVSTAGMWTSNSRTYEITRPSGDSPWFNNGEVFSNISKAENESKYLTFTFHKKADGSIDVYFETIKVISVTKSGFKIENSAFTSTTQDGMLYNSSAASNAPDASFVGTDRECVMFAQFGTVSGKVSSGGYMKVTTKVGKMLTEGKYI